MKASGDSPMFREEWGGVTMKELIFEVKTTQFILKNCEQEQTQDDDAWR